MFGAGQVILRLHRAAPLTNELWGAAVLGVPDTEPRKLRVQAARAAGGASKGTFIGFRFLVHPRLCKRDLLSVATAQVIQSFVAVKWSKAVSKEALVSCFEDGARVSAMASPWGGTR